MNEIILQIQDGTVSLPAKLRARYQLEEGDALTLLDLGGAFILSPKPALVPQLAAELEQKRKAAGLSPADLQEGLDEQRRAYIQDQGTKTKGQGQRCKSQIPISKSQK